MSTLHITYPDRLPPSKLKTIDLLQSSAHRRENGVTPAEALAWMSGEPHTEQPRSICPVLLALIRIWARNLEQLGRNTLIRPVLPFLLNTGDDRLMTAARADALMAWTIKTNAAAWLEAGGRSREATVLRTAPPKDLFRLHKALEQVIESTTPSTSNPPTPIASRAIQASGHFMPEHHRPLQHKARTAAMNGALSARRRGTKITPLVTQLQVNLVQTILSMPGIQPAGPSHEHTNPSTNRVAPPT